MTPMELRMRAVLVELLVLKDSKLSSLDFMSRSIALEAEARRIVAETDINVSTKRMRKNSPIPHEVGFGG